MTTEEDPSPKSPSRGVVIFLALLPLWLAISTGIGLWIHFRAKEEAAKSEQARFVTHVSEQGLADDMGKFLRLIGERHPGTDAGAQGLSRAAAMIEGSLGAGNAGYPVETLAGPETAAGRWPVIVASARGLDDHAAAVWVVAAYDARRGSPGAEANASGVTSVMAAANALAATRLSRPLRFAFFPHGYDADAPVAETLKLLAGRIGRGAHAVLLVEATGAGESLVVTARDAAHPALGAIGGLAEAAGEAPRELCAALSDLGLPAARVATRPEVGGEETDDALPDAAKHAAATRALVTLIERISTK